MFFSLIQCSPREFVSNTPIVVIEEEGRSMSGCSKDLFYVSAQPLKKIQKGISNIRLSFGNYSCSVLGERQTLASPDLKVFNGGYVWVKKVELWSTSHFFKNNFSKRNFIKKTGHSSKDKLIADLEKQASFVEDRLSGFKVNRNLILVEYFEYCSNKDLKFCADGEALEDPANPVLTCENEAPAEKGTIVSVTCEGETLSACKKGPKSALFIAPEMLELVRSHKMKMTIGYGNYSCLPVKKPLSLRALGLRVDDREKVAVDKVELLKSEFFSKKLEISSFLEKTGYLTSDEALAAMEAEARSLEEKFGFSIDRSRVTIEYFDYKEPESSVKKEFTTKAGGQLSTCKNKAVTDYIVVESGQLKKYLSGAYFVHIKSGSNNCHKVSHTIKIFTKEPKDIKTAKPKGTAKVIKVEVTTPNQLSFGIIQAAGFRRLPEIEALAAQDGSVSVVFFDVVIKGKKVE